MTKEAIDSTIDRLDAAVKEQTQCLLDIKSASEAGEMSMLQNMRLAMIMMSMGEQLVGSERAAKAFERAFDEEDTD